MIIIFHQGFCFSSFCKPFLGILSSFAPTTYLYHHILLLLIYVFISCFVHIHQLWYVRTVQSIAHILCKFHSSKLVRKKIWVRSQSFSQYMVQSVSRLSFCPYNSNNSCLLMCFPLPSNCVPFEAFHKMHHLKLVPWFCMNHGYFIKCTSLECHLIFWEKK
jgi:hypothetical protein